MCFRNILNNCMKTKYSQDFSDQPLTCLIPRLTFFCPYLCMLKWFLLQYIEFMVYLVHRDQVKFNTQMVYYLYTSYLEFISCV